MTITSFIHNISVFSVLVPLAIGISWYKLQEANSRTMLLLLGFASLAQLSVLIRADQIRFFCYNTYTLLDMLLWLYLFYQNIHIGKIRKLIIVMGVIEVISVLTIFINLGVNSRFYNELVCMDSLSHIAFVLIYFYDLYKNERNHKIENTSIFWFSISILIYAPSTYLLFCYFNQIKGSSFREDIWLMHDVLNTISYLIIAFGFIVNIKTRKYSDVSY